MTDLQTIALSCMMKAQVIDSENLLWSKLKKDYPSLFGELIDRSRFNPRSAKGYNP
jgi:endo-1,4-beta-D-glucanase Y